MIGKSIKIISKLIFYIVILGILSLLGSRLATGLFATPRTATIEGIESSPAAVVFGAGLWSDGSLTPVLRDRVKTAADLYLAGKVEKILMSGDNRFVDYNEPAAMREYALQLGVPEEDIVLDYAGRRTYDTCYRARDIFGLREVILVTQGFHLPRALYTCNALGLDAMGIVADQSPYRRSSLAYWYIRETFATLVGIWEVHITRPVPVLGDFEPIFPVDEIGREPGIERKP